MQRGASTDEQMFLHWSLDKGAMMGDLEVGLLEWSERLAGW